MYKLYQNNDDYWSLEYLMHTLQPKILKYLTNYWWPKYCIRMGTFTEYTKERYPLYHQLKSLKRPTTAKMSFQDLSAENIDKSLGNYNIKPFDNADLNNNNNNLASQNQINNLGDDKLLKKRKNLKVKIVLNDLVSYKQEKATAASLSLKRELDQRSQERRDAYLSELGNYSLSGDYKTSPPIGWKRPPSTATKFFNMLMENQKEPLEQSLTRSSSASHFNSDSTASLAAHKNEAEKKDKFHREIYLEAIYREDIAGQIFMKYLVQKNKIVSFV
jgi:hypothetical protein